MGKLSLPYGLMATQLAQGHSIDLECLLTRLC